MTTKDATNYIADTLQRRALGEIDDDEARECFAYVRDQVGDAALHARQGRGDRGRVARARRARRRRRRAAGLVLPAARTLE
jgi:hypothetical protein